MPTSKNRKFVTFILRVKGSNKKEPVLYEKVSKIYVVHFALVLRICQLIDFRLNFCIDEHTPFLKILAPKDLH